MARDKDKIADAAIDLGYITLNEAAHVTGKARQSVYERAKRRGVDSKERRKARIVKTLAELGRLMKEQKNKD